MREELHMADYSWVEDQDGNIRGMWLRNPADAQKRELLAALLAKHDQPSELLAKVLSGSYRVVPNTVDGAGGCFVMFGSAPTGLFTPTKPKEARSPTKASKEHLAPKKWWRFWK